jgi:hypothetical protein
MAKEKSTTSKAQREQEKLLAEALKQPGVATVAETYREIEAHTVAISAPVTTKTGYATGGNIA